MKVKWVKAHHLSGCFVGETEEIPDETRLKELLAGGFVVPFETKTENGKNKEKLENATGK